MPRNKKKELEIDLEKVYLHIPTLREFLQRLNCFEHSDLKEFLEWARGKEFDDYKDLDYILKKGDKLTENPYHWFLTLDDGRKKKFVAFIMHGYDWEETRREILESPGMTKEVLEAVAFDLDEGEEPGGFMDQLKRM